MHNLNNIIHTVYGVAIIILIITDYSLNINYRNVLHDQSNTTKIIT